MLKKEDLMMIPELKLTGRVDTMSDTKFCNYVQSINLLIDRFPRYAERFRAHLSAKTYDTLARELAFIGETLRSLYVDGIALECFKQAGVLVGAKFFEIDQNALEAAIENIILGVSSMSIEIQMADHRNRGTAQPMPHNTKEIA